MFVKGPYFVGVIFTRTTFWLPVIIVHGNHFLTVIFSCNYIDVCTILKRFSIKKTSAHDTSSSPSSSPTSSDIDTEKFVDIMS